MIPADFVKHFGILTDERCYISVRYCYTPLRRNVSIYSSGFTVEHLEIIVIADNNRKNTISNAADCADCSVLYLSVTGGRILIRRRTFWQCNYGELAILHIIQSKCNCQSYLHGCIIYSPGLLKRFNKKLSCFHDDIQNSRVQQLPVQGPFILLYYLSIFVSVLLIHFINAFYSNA